MTLPATPAPPLTVLIVDDHFVVRSGLKAALESDDGIVVIGEAERGDTVLETYKLHRPAVVLMDLQLPGLNGIQATELLLKFDESARILIFSTFARDDEIQKALDAGALGYLRKSAIRAEIVVAMRRVAQGEMYLPTGLARRLTKLRAGPAITLKEREVLALVAAGCANKEIAAQLAISEDTVKRHVSNILVKLDVNDRAQASVEAIRRGIVNLGE